MTWFSECRHDLAFPVWSQGEKIEERMAVTQVIGTSILFLEIMYENHADRIFILQRDVYKEFVKEWKIINNEHNL
jgi:hypothetical protein